MKFNRAGKIHSNVDVLSRPILYVVLVEVDTNADSFEKGLDIYEHEPLLFYIRNGKHISGAISRTVRQVNRLAKYYRFKDNHITYRAPLNDKPKIVPPIMDIVKIVKCLINRDSFIRWTHFIHNKYNEMLGKEEISLYAGIDRYLSEYKPKPVSVSESFKVRGYIIHTVLFTLCIIGITVLYRKG
jgi:hypothetical protein